MKISINWLKEFVDVPGDARRLRADLTMLGLNTEAIEKVGEDYVLDVEVTTNRPDCLSHHGVARELATLYGKPLKKLDAAVRESGEPASEAVSIEIADPDLCSRYCGRVVRDVRVGPSPEWLARRLEAIGQRPINNVADATNYVLMELGHPLHAFDFERLSQHQISVRRAKPGEPLRTLDGVARTLAKENLVIADATHAVALAGVMGGKESEISPDTHDVLLESAWFDPLSVRRTAKSQGMHTEASHRFERGADIEMAPIALDRTAGLIQQLAGGEILHGMIDVCPRPRALDAVPLRPEEIVRILGTEVAGEDVERILRGLGFSLGRRDEDGWRVTPPSWRLDVAREVDLIEEVARHVGYNHLPARVRPAPPAVERDTTRDKAMVVSATLVALGYREIISSSMVDPEESARFSKDAPVVLANPLSQDASAMRTSTVPSMLRALRWNLDRDTLNLRLFEIGKTYSLRSDGQPEERWVLSLGASGSLRPKSVYDNEKQLDYFDLKGDVEAVLAAFSLPGLEFATSGRTYYAEQRSGSFASHDGALAVFGQIRDDVQRDYKLRQPAWLGEINLEQLLGFPLRARHFRPFSKFPAVERDFSLVLPTDLSYARLSSAVADLALPEICSFRPVDQFPARHSLLLRVTFQSPTHTLTSEELDGLSARLLRALEPLGVHLRV